MITEVDERNGVVKVNWCDIRERVAKVEPVFSALVDELDIDKSFPLFLVYLPYGVLKGDTESPYLPDGVGGYYRLSDANVPKEIIKHLNYGKDGSPMGMVLEKQLEYFIDLKHKKITIPWLIYSAGHFFPFSMILGYKSKYIYAPNGLLTATSGARSTFMLPNIGCNTHHINLKRDFNLSLKAPKQLYDHWHIFKEIVNHPESKSNWKSCLLYFSEKWVSKLHSDPTWIKLKLYLHEVVWKKFEYERNRIYYDMAFSLIQEKRNLKPNPYLTDTARHLFTTALGAAPGYIPASDEEALPVDIINQAFVESYGLKKYIPTIIHPAHFDFETNVDGVYYSLQHPSTYIFSPKSRSDSSTLADMFELEHIMRIFCDELSENSNICSDTVIGKIAKDINFEYFHSKVDRQSVVRLSAEIADQDKRFLHNKINHFTGKFAGDAPFIRGCVRINHK